MEHPASTHTSLQSHQQVDNVTGVKTGQLGQGGHGQGGQDGEGGHVGPVLGIIRNLNESFFGEGEMSVGCVECSLSTVGCSSYKGASA